jgi:fructose-bisphosphate aldolase class II
MLVSSLKLFEKARAEGYAIGAFNVSTPEAVHAILEAATELSSPVIIETSEGEKKYMGAKVVADIVRDLAESSPIPVVLHLDHGKDLASVKEVVEAGYTSVHIDASAMPYEDNLKMTKEVVQYAHAHNIPVEGELGHVGGSSEKHAENSEINKATMTDPDKAAEFVHDTGIDVLASSIGNIHGVYKNPPQLDFDRLTKIGQIGLPLSLHGGSGIPEDQVKRAISLGICKVNVNTELREAYTNTLREDLDASPDEIVPYKYLPEEILAIKEVVKKKIEMFGSVGKA